MRSRMFFNGDSGRVVLSDEAISAFAIFGRGLNYTLSDSHGETVETDATLSQDLEFEGLPVRLTAVADEIVATTSGYAVSLKIQGCRRCDRPDLRYAESARLAVAGYVFCLARGVASVTLRLILASSKEESVYEYKASAEFLMAVVTALAKRAMPFIRHTYLRGRDGLPAIKKLPFPYKEMREAQYEFIHEAFRAIKSKSRLLVSAPTGTGKTISALYPAVRSIGEGLTDKVFCLCSKTTVGKAFTDAAELLAVHAPLLRCVVISSKERCCPENGIKGKRRSRMCSTGCAMYAMADGKCAELRLFEAAAECLERSVITADAIKAVAEKHVVCPHELSLTVSEYCDVIVCDYNYVFDFRMRLRRYFDPEHGTDERFVFLADEVHNLPARAADTFSAELSIEVLQNLSAYAEKLRDEDALLSSVRAVISELEGLRQSALKEGDSREINGETIRSGFVSDRNLPQKIAEAAGVLRRTLGGAILKYGDTLPPIFSDAADAVGKFCHVCSLFDRNYTCFSSAIGDEFYLRLCCLDPSPLLDEAMKKARAVVFFSATLTPISYYADILGCGRGGVLELESPFPAENLCPVAVDSVSMKLSERNASADTLAECIVAAVEARPGNYLAFFPSFDYMERVLKLFREMAPDVDVAVQKRFMKLADREAFLSAFTDERDEYSSLVGFAVLGGVFSESVDLPGDSLIGVIIAGTGMPAITSERNIMRDYFQETREGGMEYAYVYPGFNNVLQAAGRVIRTDVDRGVLILIDSRYGEAAYYRLFPKNWRHIKYTGDPFSLEEILRRFWEKPLS